MADGRAEMLKNSHFRWNGASQVLTIEPDGLAPLMLGPGDSVKTRIGADNTVIMQQD